MFSTRLMNYIWKNLVDFFVAWSICRKSNSKNFMLFIKELDNLVKFHKKYKKSVAFKCFGHLFFVNFFLWDLTLPGLFETVFFYYEQYYFGFYFFSLLLYFCPTLCLFLGSSLFFSSCPTRLSLKSIYYYWILLLVGGFKSFIKTLPED